MHHTLRVICTIWLGIQLMCIWCFAFFVELFVIACIYRFCTVNRRKDIVEKIHRAASLLAWRWLNPFWRVQIKYQTQWAKTGFVPPGTTKFLFMSNHLSNCDPWMISATLFPTAFKFIAKASLYNVPFGGWSGRLCGDIAVHFTKEKDGWGTKKGSTAVMMQECKECLDRGMPVMVYPEGQRNPEPEGPLQDFRDGMFKFALEQGAAIVPIAMSGSDKFWPVKENLLDAGQAYITVGEPIFCAPDDTVEKLKARVYQVITDLRESHPDRQKSENLK